MIQHYKNFNFYINIGLKFIILLIVSTQILLAQPKDSRFFSEAPIYFENGVRYSNQIIVHFKEKLFDLPYGKNVAENSEIEKTPTSIKPFFKDMQKKYGTFKLIKRVPNSVWGDTLRPHSITGEPVRVHDYSQLFTIYFNNSVPIDSIIEELNLRKDVEYAEPPFQAMSLIEPNDLLSGSTGNQWNLYKINAPSAWEITKGSTEVVVGMIEIAGVSDNGLPNRSLGEFTNTDGTSKFHPTKGDFFSGNASGHANQVASIIGAATNDGDGFASLGWNILIAPYRVTQLIDGTGSGTFEAAIDRAQAHDIKIINCSFITKELVSSGGGCYVFREKDWGSVRRGIQDALGMGITVIAATGNSVFDLIEGTCDPEDYRDIHPYAPYPASYDGVIGISATTITDGFAYTDYQGQQYLYNHGGSVDFCAPGKNILTVGGSGYHPIESGTSLASPQVAALIGLMKSLKPDLTTSQIEEILQSTVVDLGTAGKDTYFGYGRIDAHKALLEVLDMLASENKSINPTATGQNNGRRLVKDGSGNYHLVFASGGEIFYRKIIGGTSWQTPILLSNGNGNNNYPSISQSGGRIYATWQRNTGSNNYDIYFTVSTNGGTNWNTKYVLNSVTTATEPLPTIQAASSYEMVVFCYGSGIKSYWSYYTVPSYPSYWTVRTVGFSTSYSPTVTSAYQSPTYYFPMAIANSSDNHIYYYYFNSSTTYWNGGPNNLSTIVPGSNAVHITPSITSIPGTSQIHVAWKKLIGSGSSIYDHLIIHRKSTNYYTWPNEWFGTYYNKQENPSISALATNKVDLLYHTPSQFGTQYIYKMRFSGSNWGSPTSIAGSSGYPSVSSDNTTGKYVWTNGSGSPYTIMLSSETLQKELEINPLDYYTRSVAWLDSSGSYIEIRLSPVYLKMKDGTKQRIDIIPASLDTFNLTQDNSWTMLSTVPFQISSDAEEVVFDYSISAEGVDKVLSTKVDNIQPVFNLISNSDEVIANLTRSHVISSNKLQELRQQFTMPLNSIDKAQVLKAEIKLNDLIPKPGTFASLGHIYDYSALEEGEKIAKTVTKQINELSIQNYPNPFNPSTSIEYQIPESGFVTLKVYDVLGREITTLVNEEKPTGTYAINFNAVNLASGIYFYTITVGEFSQTKKMILLR